MSDRLVDRAILEGLVTQAAGRCRFCECEGGSCKTDEPGEKCVLVGPRGLETRCNGFECMLKYRAEQRRCGRKWKRSAA